jgi:cytochrome c1
LVGPPYNEVLPKYVNNKDALVQFILNPQKINPAYPAMPNQGLKPNEARAVAEYILSTYQK